MGTKIYLDCPEKISFTTVYLLNTKDDLPIKDEYDITIKAKLFEKIMLDDGSFQYKFIINNKEFVSV